METRKLWCIVELNIPGFQTQILEDQPEINRTLRRKNSGNHLPDTKGLIFIEYGMEIKRPLHCAQRQGPPIVEGECAAFGTDRIFLLLILVPGHKIGSFFSS